MFYADYPVAFPSSTPCKEDKFESPLCKALSPISPNMVTLKQQTDEDLDYPLSLEPKTPIGACNILGMISSATPLDKLSAHGSDLMVCMISSCFIQQQSVLVEYRSLNVYFIQESYVQQYLEFLNVASK